MRRIAMISACILLGGCTLKFGPDKIDHSIVGVAVAGTVDGIGGSLRSACAASILAGAAKEVYDSTGRGDVDPMDFASTAVSGCVFAYAFPLFRRWWANAFHQDAKFRITNNDDMD